MKTKYKIFLIAISAVVTLSFTFSGVSKSKDAQKEVSTSTKSINSEPAGGFVSEDKF